MWIRLPEVPLEYFTKKSMQCIGNAFGRLVKVDNTTTTTSRGKYARICVELDLSKPLLPSTYIAGILTFVEYEGLHQIYFECGQYGHNAEECPRHVMVGSTTLDYGAAGEASHVEGEVRGPYRPWMLPTY